MIKNIHVWLWGIVAELEYKLYPWKTNTPPDWAASKYNLDIDIKDPYDQDNIYYDWIKSHNEKINKIEANIINLYTEIESLKSK